MGFGSSKDKKPEDNQITDQELKILLEMSKEKSIQNRDEIKPKLEQKKNEIVDLLKTDKIITPKVMVKYILQDEGEFETYDLLISIIENIKEKCDFTSDKECPPEVKNNLMIINYTSIRFNISTLGLLKDKIYKKYGSKCIVEPGTDESKKENELLKKFKQKEFSEKIKYEGLKQLCHEKNIECPGLIFYKILTEINSEINGFYSKAKITQKFDNPLNQPLELKVYIPKKEKIIFSSFDCQIGDSIKVKS